MPPLLSSLIRTKDFKRTSFYFVLKNETSGILIDQFEDIHPCEFEKNSLSLTLPKNSCSQGQKLMVYLFVDNDIAQIKKCIKGRNFKGALELYTKVEQEKSYEDEQSVDLKILECQESKWLKVIDRVKSIQNEVTQVSLPISPDLEISDEEFEDEDGKEI